MYSHKTLLDVHTHTVASGHAYSSLQEMAQAAAQKGIQILGITEHGPAVPGSCYPIYFRNAHCIPRTMYGVRLLIGCEINILDTEGHLDIDDELMPRLDFRIAGIHKICWKGGTREENTQGMIAAIRNPFVQMISHPGDATCDLDFEPIVDAACETHTLLEINNHSLAPARGKVAARENNLEILRLCKERNMPVIMGSDAHISFMIAEYDRVLPLLEEVDYPEELVMNFWPDKFFDYIKKLP